MDLNQKVSNPGLVAAIEAVRATHDEATNQELRLQLAQAVFLVGIESSTDDDPQYLTVTDRAGSELLPLFTDRDELVAWFGDSVPVHALRASIAWATVMADYAGFVINPAAQGMGMTVDQLRGFLEG